MVPFEAFPLSIFEVFLTIVYLACASTVTVNALLKKSDVRSALGWIAVAWLSPFLGALLYYLFGINRVTRRALKLEKITSLETDNARFAAHPDGGTNITALAAISQRVTNAALTAGNAIEVLHGGEVAFPAMLRAIRTARKSIAMVSYIFRSDAVGAEFVAALMEAHARGVQVRVLLDGVGSGYFWSGALQHLVTAGIPAARFLHTWIPWRMPFLNMRNHRKLLIVDGDLGFVGGMNIGGEYSRDLLSKNAIEDFHFQVTGPVVRQMMDAFARDWAFTTDDLLDDDIWWPKATAQGNVFARGVRSGPDADIYKLEIMLGAALTQAQHRIRVVTPYFLPDQRLQFAIAQAVLRGVEVDILIPEDGDHWFFNWATRAHLRFFRHIPANFYLTSAPFTHAKLVTMDGEWCLIGSSNWDARSLRLNFEFDLECYDGSLPAVLDAWIDRRISSARKVDAAVLAAPVWILVRDAAMRLLLPYL